MTIAERIAYLKGVADALELSAGDKKDQLLVSVLEVLDDIALNLVDLENDVDTLAAQVDEIDEDLGTLEEDYYDLDDCDCGCDCDCDDDDCDCGCCCGDDCDCIEAVCPQCGADIPLNLEDLENGAPIVCPECEAELDFELVDDDEEDLED